MKLTRVERWILSNQYRILEQLHPQEGDWYSRSREALEQGYEREYDRIAQFVYADKDCMPVEQGVEVFEILLMFCELLDAYQTLDDTSIDPGYIRFRGFDGNNEAAHLAYCRYLCEDERNTRFRRLERGDDYNSHMPLLDNYRRMLADWRERGGGRRQLTKDDVIAIISQAPHPDSEVGKAMRDEGPRH